jgi:hypothetical protein
MKTAPRFRNLLSFLLLVLLLTPMPGFAQHIFLDLTGDGANTSADVLRGILPVNVDVYLVSDRNRDGSPAACASGAEPLSVDSFEFILRATGGTVLWGPFIGGSLGSATLTAQNLTDIYVGSLPLLPVRLPPGKIHLGRLRVTRLSGAPLLNFATSTSLSASYLTSFGSQCGGAEGDNTLKLGEDWFDADGTVGQLVRNVSGTVFLDRNGVSLLGCAPEAGEPVLPGWTVSLGLGGPSVLTNRLGYFEFWNVPAGVQTLQLSPAPGWNQTCPLGGLPQIVTVLPNQTYPNVNFGVRPSNSPPALLSIPNVTALVGTITNQLLTAIDPDLNSVTFSLAGGPSFASVTTIGPAIGNLRLAPEQGDVGNYSVAVSASDGVLVSERRTKVTVPTAGAGAAALPNTSRISSGELAVSITPNPHFAPATLSFRTSKPGFVRAILYDMNGRLIRTLENQPMAPAGDHDLVIDGRDDVGRPMASGVYFFKVETSEGSRVGRAIMLR